MKKTILIAGLVVFVGVLWFSIQQQMTARYGVFTLYNNSGQMIDSANVTVCEQSFSFNDLKDSDSIAAQYLIKSDSHFDVRIIFASGKELTSQLGYVTNGIASLDTITISEKGTELKTLLLHNLN